MRYSCKQGGRNRFFKKGLKQVTDTDPSTTNVLILYLVQELFAVPSTNREPQTTPINLGLVSESGESD